MKRHGPAAAVLVAVVLVGLLIAPPTTERDLDLDAAVGADASPGEAEQPRSAERAAVASAPVAPVAPKAPGAPSTKGAPERESQEVAGKVLDPRGEPLPYAEVHYAAQSSPDGGALLAVCDAKGRFSTDYPAGSGVLDTAGDYVGIRAWVVLPAPEDGAGPPPEPIIVAAAAFALSGEVVDQSERGIAGVRISARCLSLPFFPARLDGVRRTTLEGGRSDARGDFHLPRMPRCARVVLSFSKDGYKTVERPIDERHWQEPWHVVLEADGTADTGNLRVSGKVVDRHGNPVSGALIGLGGVTGRTDVAGEYALDIPQRVYARENLTLFAAAKDQRTVFDEDVAGRIRARDKHELNIDVTFGDDPLAIHGRVVDASEKPVAGLVVYLVDPSWLEGGGIAAEAASAGFSGDPYGIRITTDASGRFALGGLNDRTYRLRVLDTGVPVVIDSDPIQAGRRDVILRVPEAAVRSDLEGRIVDLRGRGVRGLRVRIEAIARGHAPDGPVVVKGASHTTDGKGAVRIPRAPRADARLTVRGEGFLPLTVAIEELAGDERFKLTVEGRYDFRVAAPGAPEGATLRAVDADDRPLKLHAFDADGHAYASSWALTGGRTPVLSVSERATRIILSLGDRVLYRAVLKSSDGTVAVIKW